MYISNKKKILFVDELLKQYPHLTRIEAEELIDKLIVFWSNIIDES